MSAGRYLFYAVNGLGLGHVTRLISIARALRRLEREAEILFLTSSEADGVIYREGFAAVKLPSKSIREQTRLSKSAFLRTAQSVTWSAISAFDPDVLVVDTFPAGSFEELLPVLRWRQRNVFVFREQRPEHGAGELMQATLRLYDRIVVPHASIDEVGPLPEPKKAIAVGPILIRQRSELLGRDEARERLGVDPDRRLGYVSFGGGGDADAPDALVLAAQVMKDAGVTPVIGVGALARRSPSIPGSLALPERQPALEVLAAFDAAISGAGYNSVHELLFAGVPSVLVPFERQVDDQLRRAEQAQSKGAAICCPRLDGPALRQCLDQALDPARAKAMRKSAMKLVPDGGAERAAKAIRELA